MELCAISAISARLSSDARISGALDRAAEPAHAVPRRAVEVDGLGLDDVQGGFSGLALSGPDGRAYAFALRPLLPDEAY